MRPPITPTNPTNPTRRSPLTDPTYPLRISGTAHRYKDKQGYFGYTTMDMANDPRWTLIEPLFDPPYYIQISE